jgi:hypothetical protein
VTSTDLLDRLPPSLQSRFREIGAAARGPLGDLRDFQGICNAEIGFFDRLVAGGLKQDALARLLAEVGIARPDGGPLPPGTLSSALSRARRLAAAAATSSSGSGSILQSPAVSGTTLQDPAPSGSALPPPAETAAPPSIPKRRSVRRRPTAEVAWPAVSAVRGRRPSLRGRPQADAAETEASEARALAALARDPSAARNVRTASLLKQTRS